MQGELVPIDAFTKLTDAPASYTGQSPVILPGFTNTGLQINTGVVW